MAKFDIPNEEELKPNKLYDYNLVQEEYDISKNRVTNVYDQFISLRDTLVFSDKYYPNNAWRSLIIWTKPDGTATGTIEIREPNIVKLDFNPGWAVTTTSKGNYIGTGGHSWISCEIKKKWRYRIQHKEQFNNIDTGITRIHCYVVQHKTDGTTQSRAVFDWEWNTWWEILRMTSFGYVECDLDVWDWLELKLEDQSGNDIQSEMATDSNWWMVEYIDLAYNI